MLEVGFLNKKMKLTVLFFFLLNNIAFAQIVPPLSVKDSIQYRLEYEYACKVIEEAKEPWHLNFVHYWNRYCRSKGILPEEVSIELWNDIFLRYPELSCQQKDHSISILHNLSMTEQVFYKKYKLYFDSCCGEFYNSLDSNLILVLRDIHERDQRYRQKMQEAITPAMNKDYWRKQHHLDSLNLMQADSIFINYGYPGRDIVGIDNEGIMFLVVQHSNLESMEKYLPFIKKEIENETLNPKYYAYILDRIQMIKDLPQVFGTQVVENKRGLWELYKMQSMHRIDDLRESYNLGSLKRYLDDFGIRLEK